MNLHTPRRLAFHTYTSLRAGSSRELTHTRPHPADARARRGHAHPDRSVGWSLRIGARGLLTHAPVSPHAPHISLVHTPPGCLGTEPLGGAHTFPHARTPRGPASRPEHSPSGSRQGPKGLALAGCGVNPRPVPACSNLCLQVPHHAVSPPTPELG